jgi:putative endonuclease
MSDDAESASNLHYVYILHCADDTLYTGYTTNPARRIAEHNAGTGAKYTRGRTPVKLVHTERFQSKSAAMRREYVIKQLGRPAKDQLVDGERPTPGERVVPQTLLE